MIKPINILDLEERDEFRLAGILELLVGQWRFVKEDIPRGQYQTVDIKTTNETLVLNGYDLDSFRGVETDDKKIITIDNCFPSGSLLDPNKISIIFLCGGLGTRSGGKVHPLLYVKESNRKNKRTILDIQIDRFINSPLNRAKVLILGSLLNEEALKDHIKRLSVLISPKLFFCGLTARLSLYQCTKGPPILHYDKLGLHSYNPTGHFDALRWLIISGMFTYIRDTEILIIMSYSNLGKIFDEETLRIASFVSEYINKNPDILYFVEVVSRAIEKKSGSILVTLESIPKEFRLYKNIYGNRKPRISNTNILMSTNINYVSVPRLFQKLKQACPSNNLSSDTNSLNQLLQEAANNKRRSTVARLFDAAFPINPYLSLKVTREGAKVLQAERDLDQISLMKGPSPLKVIKVREDRAISIKHLSDIIKLDHHKNEYLRYKK